MTGFVFGLVFIFSLKLKRLIYLQESQIAIDNISEINEGRKNIFYALVFLLVVSFFPYLEFTSSFNLIVDSSLGYVRELFTSGASRNSF